MWFDPGELTKNKTDTLANFANPANYETENIKTDSLISKLAELAEPFNSENIIVICYSPSGLAYAVEATSAEHAESLQRMNPKPIRA